MPRPRSKRFSGSPRSVIVGLRPAGSVQRAAGVGVEAEAAVRPAAARRSRGCGPSGLQSLTRTSDGGQHPAADERVEGGQRPRCWSAMPSVSAGWTTLSAEHVGQLGDLAAPIRVSARAPADQQTRHRRRATSTTSAGRDATCSSDRAQPRAHAAGPRAALAGPGDHAPGRTTRRGDGGGWSAAPARVVRSTSGRHAPPCRAGVIAVGPESSCDRRGPPWPVCAPSVAARAAGGAGSVPRVVGTRARARAPRSSPGSVVRRRGCGRHPARSSVPRSRSSPGSVPVPPLRSSPGSAVGAAVVARLDRGRRGDGRPSPRSGSRSWAGACSRRRARARRSRPWSSK